MKSTILDKTKLVNSVFSKVYKKYDLMNDIMSLGVHRIWKKKLIDWMNPQLNDSLIDVASGTGDIAKIFSEKINYLSKVSCVEPNNEMYSAGKQNLRDFQNITWYKAKAEKLPFKNHDLDSIILYHFVSRHWFGSVPGRGPSLCCRARHRAWIVHGRN